MASPIIKIKRGTLKPPNYNLASGTQTGLTSGELGVLLDATNSRYAFYIGNQSGVAITFGCEVTTDAVWNPASDFKVPTQAAIKTYIQNLGGSPPSGSSSVEIISRSLTGPDGSVNGITANPTAIVKFGQLEFATPTTGIPGLAYNSTTGRFTYSGITAINLLITYQVTWSAPTSATTYNNLEAVRSSWIQKNPTGIGAPNTEMYGYNTLIIPPQAANSIGSVSGTMNGSAVIPFAASANETFEIQCRTQGAQTFIRTVSTLNTGSPTTNFNKATNIQIAKI